MNVDVFFIIALLICSIGYYAILWHEGNRKTEKPIQHTICAVCLKDKPTPIRNDVMGGYVCLSCVDKELERLQIEAAAWKKIVMDGIEELGFEINECPRCGKTDPMTEYDIYLNLSVGRDAILSGDQSFIPRGKEHEIKCNYSECDWGQGLAGIGRCSGRGNPRDAQCQKFTTEAADYNPEEEGGDE